MNSLPRALPADYGVDPRGLVNLFDALDALGCHSAMLARRGHVLAEGWWKPYAPSLPHSLYSITKGFTSLAVGFAVEEGLLSLDDTVADFFSDYLPCAPCDHMRELTVRHLLTGTLGHISRMDHDFFREADWVREAVRLYLELKPGTRFNYDNRCANLLSSLVQRRTGQTLRDWLEPRLFHKLGIRRIDWEENQGSSIGGWGLWLTTEELMRYGLFLLNRGAQNGERIIDPGWIDEASAAHVDTRGCRLNGMPHNRSQEAGYGYHFWRCPVEGGKGAFRGTGACGQQCIVLPEQEAVLVITAGSDASGDILENVWKHLIPAFDAPGIHPGSQPDLEARLASLAVAQPVGDSLPPTLVERGGLSYAMADNPLGITRMAFDFGETDLVSFWLGDACFTVRAGHGEWISTHGAITSRGLPDTMTTVFYPDAACCAAWEDASYTLRLAYTKASFVDTLRLSFDDWGITGEYRCSPYLPLRGRGTPLIGRKFLKLLSI